MPTKFKYETPVDRYGPVRAYIMDGGYAKDGEALWRVAFGYNGTLDMTPVGPSLPFDEVRAIVKRLNTEAGLDRESDWVQEEQTFDEAF